MSHLPPPKRGQLQSSYSPRRHSARRGSHFFAFHSEDGEQKSTALRGLNLLPSTRYTRRWSDRTSKLRALLLPSSLPCHSLSDGRSTAKEKNDIFLRVLGASSDSSGRSSKSEARSGRFVSFRYSRSKAGTIAEVNGRKD